MSVWVVVQGLYADAMVTGVYASAEAAKADQEGEQRWTWDEEVGLWENHLDWQDHVSIEEWEVKGA